MKEKKKKQIWSRKKNANHESVKVADENYLCSQLQRIRCEIEKENHLYKLIDYEQMWILKVEST